MNTHTTQETCDHITEGLTLGRLRVHYSERSHIAELLGQTQEYLNLRNIIQAIDEEMSLNLTDHRQTCDTDEEKTR